MCYCIDLFNPSHFAYTSYIVWNQMHTAETSIDHSSPQPWTCTEGERGETSGHLGDRGTKSKQVEPQQQLLCILLNQVLPSHNTIAQHNYRWERVRDWRRWRRKSARDKGKRDSYPVLLVDGREVAGLLSCWTWGLLSWWTWGSEAPMAPRLQISGGF